MGKQSARLWFEGHDHKDIYFAGHYHDKMYLGSALLWEKLPSAHPKYSQFFMVDEVISSYGPDVVDEYGARLEINSDAVVEKCGVYLTGSGSNYQRTLAFKGSGVTAATYVPYLSYHGEVVYDGTTSSSINTFPLTADSSGVYSYKNYTLIHVNLTDASGTALTAHSIGVDTENVRLFYNLTEMKNWLQS